MNTLLNYILIYLSVTSLLTEPIMALPIGFGRNQGKLKYDEIVSKHFEVYFDDRAPHEAKAISNSLENGKPTIEKWLGVHRKKRSNVVMSASTSNASFANFVYDAIELQTMGRGGRDLAWHEFTHATMYEHFNGIFGHVSSTIYLPWLPAWWIEGLADSFSVSSQSDWQYSIERSAAFTGSWPTYDRLHSLYNDRFGIIGYPISAAFVSWMIRKYDKEKLDKVLEEFVWDANPIFWPWTLIPYFGDLPFDVTLKKWTGKNGEELYEEYKRDATKYWLKNASGPYINAKFNRIFYQYPKDLTKSFMGSKIGITSTFFLSSDGTNVYSIFSKDNEAYSTKLKFKNYKDSDDSISAQWIFDKRPIAKKIDTYLKTKKYEYYTTETVKDDLSRTRTLWYKNSYGKSEKVLTTPADIQRLFAGNKELYWYQIDTEKSAVCAISYKKIHSRKKIKRNDYKCKDSLFPASISILGHESDSKNSYTKYLWLKLKTEKLTGDSNHILKLDTDTHKLSEIKHSYNGTPISYAKIASDNWLLLGDRKERFLRKVGSDGRCISEKNISNLATKLLNNNQNEMILSYFEDGFNYILKSDLKDIKESKCKLRSTHQSPVLMAMNYKGIGVNKAFELTDPWEPQDEKIKIKLIENIKEAKRLDEVNTKLKVEEVQWRADPNFAFPWIGVDAMGYQLGIVSVPLMDHMQNETLEMRLLWGLKSQYPGVSFNLVTTRFKPTYVLSAFKQQAWNGSLNGQVYYYDEVGGAVSMSNYFYRYDFSLRLGLKSANLQPYIGNPAVWEKLGTGMNNEFSLSLSKSHDLNFGLLSYFTSLNWAPDGLNPEFNYNRLSLGTRYSYPLKLGWMSTIQKWGLSYGQTRGPARKLLQEVYRPLRTFVPGSGGGLNNLNFNLVGLPYLTSASYGDTQSRFEFSWSFPLFPHLSKMVHIFYLDRIDLTAFFNYGDAWYEGINQPALNDMIGAQGYNLDLQTDIKGITVNLGTGVGQVFGKNWEMYILFGFDAIVNI